MSPSVSLEGHQEQTSPLPASPLLPGGGRRPATPLSVAIPHPSHFFPPPPRPTSSLSQAGSGDSDSGVERESFDAWEEDQEGLIDGTPSRSARDYWSAQGSHDEDYEDLGDLTDAPSTPITLPPASLASSPSPASPAAFVQPPEMDELDTDSQRDSFPSSDEGLSIGLGVGDAVISNLERRLQMRSIEEMRSRALEGDRRAEGADDLAELGEAGENGENQAWKVEVLLADVLAARAAEDAADDAGVGGSRSAAAGSVPFPALVRTSSVLPDGASELNRDLPPLPPSNDRPESSTSQATRSLRPSNASTSASSNSSTLSLPTVPPVDLTLPNHRAVTTSGTFMSVASGPMARLAVDSTGGLSRSQSQSSRGPRSFFSNLLSRSPRSPNPIASTPSPFSTSPPPFTPRSPSDSSGLSSPGPSHPSIALAQRQSQHLRSASLPNSPEARSVRSFEGRPPSSPTPSTSQLPRPRTPINAGDPRGLPGSPSPSYRGLPDSATNSPSLSGAGFSPFLPSRSRTAPSSPNTSNSSSGPAPPTAPAVPLPTLGSIGLSLVPLTQPLSVSRHSQPLCGALLDDKYILIGTTGGLDFLPIPLPGSLPMRTHGKKRRETRKPIPLIKRTRFKELAVLSERSNILLAIAGRNDHIRVYALDGIRAMIEKKMAELNLRDGYPIIPDATVLRPNAKGKARAEGTTPARSAPPSPSIFPPTSQPSGSTSSQPYQFPTTSPPPDYLATTTTSATRRRPPPLNSTALASSYFPPPASPIRSNSRPPSAGGTLVRAVPTNRTSTSIPSSPRTLRGSKSREFVASRRGSTAVVPKRRSRGDMTGDNTSISAASRRSSVHSTDGYPTPRRGSFADISSAALLRRGSLGATLAVPEAETDDFEDAGDEAEVRQHLSPPGSIVVRRRPSTEPAGESGWSTDPSGSSPVVGRTLPRMEARAPSVALSHRQGSPALDLADFLRNTGPEPVSPAISFGLLGDSASSSRRPSNAAGWAQETLEAAQRTSKPRHVPRSATTTTLDETTGRSPTLDLADFIRNGPPGDRNGSVSSTSGVASFQTKRIAREASSPPLRQGERSSNLDLADMIRNTGPEDGSSFHLENPSSSTTGLLDQASPPAGASRSRSPSPIVQKSAAKPPLQPRDPVPRRLGPNERSPTLELAYLLRSTGPPGPSSANASGRFPSRTPAPTVDSANKGNSANKGKEVERPSSSQGFTPRPRTEASSSSMQRHPSAGGKLVARSATTARVESDEDEELEDGGARRRGSGTSLLDAIRDGPPPGFESGPLLPSSASAQGVGPPSSPGSRQSKRWTMGGMHSMFLNRPSHDGGPTHASSRRESTETRRSSLQFDSHPDTMISPVDAAPAVPSPAVPLASTPLPPHDFKRAPASMYPQEQPSLPVSSQIPPDAHPANSNSPLEYVKLARTKGARLLRAVETKKRTYLAVLCGDEGERIELFTGSRSISLSLNRTFVLPENPRTIEFQIQGDDLIDIYLVYPESIFALEPATVRVREVGVGRGERRARRDRERRLRDIASSSTVEPGAPANDPPVPPMLHPADPALTERRDEDSGADLDPLQRGLEIESRSPSPSPAVSPAPRTPINETPPPLPQTSPLTESSSRPTAPPPPVLPADAPPPVPPRAKNALPYSTFQQLPFVPPVPSSVLASAWVIPPLYSDVVGGDAGPSGPHPSITVTTTGGRDVFSSPDLNGEEDLSPPPSFSHRDPSRDYPLLSPVSLLGGAAQRANGPPGLFFVNRGRNLSGIVTGDGRSVIKKPLVWSLDKAAEGDQGVDVYRKIEILIVRGTKTVVVGVGAFEVKAIAVGGAAGEAPFEPAVSLCPTVPPKSGDVNDIVFLGTQAKTNQLFFTERVGTSWKAWCVGTRE